MRRFFLLRHEDVNGFSGTGVVAEGVIFDDGTGAFTWLTPMKTVTTFWKMADIRHMHGHDGKTEVVIEGTNKKKFEECAAAAKVLKDQQRAERKQRQRKGENDEQETKAQETKGKVKAKQTKRSSIVTPK